MDNLIVNQKEKVKIKICGITNVDDALQIASFGVDALGFVFAKSPRQVDIDTAKHIISRLPSFITTVGVYVNMPVDFIQKTITHCGIDLVQLHGDEGIDVCEIFFPRVIKVARIRSQEDIHSLVPYVDIVRAFLLDTYSKKAYGGTGEVGNWELAKYAVTFLQKPVILAGGINPDNCIKAIEMVNPYAIDVSSGVELSPGKKDLEKAKKLISLVKNLN